MGGRQRDVDDGADHESEPLVSAEEDGDVPNASSSGISDHDDNGQLHGEARFPPQKYLKSTYASREAQYDLDTDDLAESDGEANIDAQRLPALHGLMGSAASRGSVETTRNHDENDFELDGLSVGGGKGSILASVSQVRWISETLRVAEQVGYTAT
jgi:hypothetical protein